MKADDADSGDNGEIQYTIHDINDTAGSKYFRVRN